MLFLKMMSSAKEGWSMWKVIVRDSNGAEKRVKTTYRHGNIGRNFIFYIAGRDNTTFNLSNYHGMFKNGKKSQHG